MNTNYFKIGYLAATLCQMAACAEELVPLKSNVTVVYDGRNVWVYRCKKAAP